MLLRLLFVALMATSAIAKPLHCKKKGLTKCGRTCADLQTDTNHCGTCNTVCPDTYTCEAGECTAPPPPSGTCTSGSTCNNIVPCNDDESCFCIKGSEGEFVCNTGGTTGCEQAERCNADSDCTSSSGGFCGQDSCCDSGPNGEQGVCLYADSCPNESAPSKMFRRERAEKREPNLWTTTNDD